MFSRGIEELLKALPVFAGLDSVSARRLLSGAYLESLDLRDAADTDEDARSRLAHDLIRLGSALEVHAILAPDVSTDMLRACSFVAAESLSIVDELAPPDSVNVAVPSPVRLLEAGLLYLIAGYDANAAVTARQIDPSEIEAEISSGPSAQYAAGEIREFLLLGSSPPLEAPVDDADAPVALRVRAELWRRLGRAARGQLEWLRSAAGGNQLAEGGLDRLVTVLTEERASSYADLAHIAQLMRLAFDQTSARALRGVPSPGGDGTVEFGVYRSTRSSRRPLLWPAASEYADACLPGPHTHAVVAVPTGAGKSSVAELAAASALGRGWVLYLAPTNALVGQIRRDLRNALAPYPGASVQRFLGGAELSGAAEEVIVDTAGQVLVMTPEKCSLALRQSPEAFESLALCVMDECHLLGESGTRGVLAELVLAHVLAAAPEVRLLLMSALTSNPEELAAWLASATEHRAIEIREPWRPTRTLRAAVGFDRETLLARAEVAARELRAKPARRNMGFSAPVALLANLEGPWATDDADAYQLVRTHLEVPLSLHREAGDDDMAVTSAGYVNPTVGALSEKLAVEGQRVLAFLPRNKHYSFSVGATIDATRESDPEVALGVEVGAYLDLADYELGLRSGLRDLLNRRVAVHTSALLANEQRASEIAFNEDIAHVMFATSTLAQGLNLPATTVIVGGTTIGDPRGLSSAESQRRIRAQLLNAFGRAGRAYVAARSLAVIVPDKPIEFQAVEASRQVLEATPFLREEDASDAVRSQLGNLIDLALRGEVDERYMTAEDLAAFAVLPLGADGAPGQIVRRTYAAWSRNASSIESSDVIAGALVRAGQSFLGDRPSWLVDAAYLAGLTVQQTLALHDAYVSYLGVDDLQTFAGWADRLFAVLADLRPEILEGLIPRASVRGTTAAGIHADDRALGWEALRDGLGAWMAGLPMESVAVSLVGDVAAGDARRTQQAPLPKVLRVVQEVFVFQLSRLAGSLVALHEIGIREGEEAWALSDESKPWLDLLPLAIRNGCSDDGSLAWSRFATDQRRVAHLLARHLQHPSDLAVEEVPHWIRQAHGAFLENVDEDEWPDLSDGDRDALKAWRRLVAAERDGVA